MRFYLLIFLIFVSIHSSAQRLYDQLNFTSYSCLSATVDSLKNKQKLNYISSDYFKLLLQNRQYNGLSKRIDTCQADSLLIVERIYDYDSSITQYESYFYSGKQHLHNPNRQAFDLKEIPLSVGGCFMVEQLQRRYHTYDYSRNRKSNKKQAQAFRKNILASYYIYTFYDGSEIKTVFVAPAHPDSKMKISVYVINVTF